MGKQDLYISFFSIVGMSTFRKWTRYIRNGETSTTYQNLNGYLIHTIHWWLYWRQNYLCMLYYIFIKLNMAWPFLYNITWIANKTENVFGIGIKKERNYEWNILVIITLCQGKICSVINNFFTKNLIT